MEDSAEAVLSIVVDNIFCHWLCQMPNARDHLPKLA